jgi:hypothetical protein
LDFNACQPFPPEGGRGGGWFIRAITDILAARPRIRIRSFRFVMYGWGFDGRLAVVDGWFRALARHGVREIDVDMFYGLSLGPSSSSPPSKPSKCITADFRMPGRRPRRGSPPSRYSTCQV